MSRPAIGTTVDYQGVRGKVVGYWGGSLTIEFDGPLPNGRLLHNCYDYVPSGRGRWMGIEEITIIADPNPLHEKVMAYIGKELR